MVDVRGDVLSHLSPLTLMVVGAPQMTLQQYLSTFPSSATLREPPNPISVHDLTFSSHFVFCLPLRPAPVTVPC